MAARFKLDENMPRDAEALLREAQHDVHSVLDDVFAISESAYRHSDSSGNHCMATYYHWDNACPAFTPFEPFDKASSTRSVP